MKIKSLCIIFCALSSLLFTSAFGQVGISDTGAVAPDPKAILDLSSESKGALLPRLTSLQMSSLIPAPDGLLIYNTDSSQFYYFNGHIGGWQSLTPGNDTIRHICGAAFQDARDGHIYTTVQIGTQCWMRENLDVGAWIDHNDNQSNNGIIEKYCYDNNEANCETYGGLYQWGEIMHYVTNEGVQGICPGGWHVPAGGEWSGLTDYLNNGGFAGEKMKATSGWSGGGNGSNSSGFTALPGGFRSSNTFFYYLGFVGIFWTSSLNDQTSAFRRNLNYNNNWCLSDVGEIHHGFSVRCIKGQGAVAQPTVTTADISNITLTTATGGGNVIADGGNEGEVDVTARGVCWNLTGMPTISDNFTSDSAGTGAFTSNLTRLSSDETYYVRAYATNIAGTSYGDEVTFTTLINEVLPTLTTTPASDIAYNAAISGGNITNPGISDVIMRGVCWNTEGMPTLSDDLTTDGGGTGTFESEITGLNEFTLYYVRAYATNSAGTSYGDEVSFITAHEPCPGIPTVTYGGQTYHTVIIGTQCWIQENLNIGTRIDGIMNQVDNDTIEKYCYDDNEANCDTYGGLYQWNEIMEYEVIEGIQGICPAGWHLPANGEWSGLTDYLGGGAGGKMKSTSGWNNGGNGSNSSGFTALPGGFHSSNTLYYYLGSAAIFWSSTLYDQTNAYRRNLNDYSDWCQSDLGELHQGFSVRCLKDN